MKNNITIRDYNEKDWTRIEEIHDVARKTELKFAKLDDAFLPLKIAAEREDLFDYKLSVAEINNKVVGFTAYEDGELAWLYVDPNELRKGIGRKLVKYVVDKCTTLEVEIEVLFGNTPAIELYKSVGFEITETLSGVMPGNESFDVTVNVLVLKK